MNIELEIGSIVKELGVTKSHATELELQILDSVKSAYYSSGRHYHNAEHILYVLNVLESFDGTEQERMALKLATLFHDIVYDPRRKDNEEQSVKKFLSILGDLISEELASQVVQLITVTKNHFAATTKLEQAFADADMMIFAEDEKTYSQYAANIRKEYNHLDDESYAIGRLNFLSKLQEHQEREGKLFYNLSSARNERARQNIAREIVFTSYRESCSLLT